MGMGVNCVERSISSSMVGFRGYFVINSALSVHYRCSIFTSASIVFWIRFCLSCVPMVSALRAVWLGITVSAPQKYSLLLRLCCVFYWLYPSYILMTI